MIVSTLDALLAAVLAAPEDDAPRLVYADALEETGEASNVARAEFIRVQCEIAERAASGREAAECSWGGTCGCRSHVLRRRERQLLDAHGHRWVAEWHAEGNPGLSFYHGGVGNWIRRGFFERVELPCTVFMQHAAALFASHPITRVTLTDKEPYYTFGGNFAWTTSDEYNSAALPDSLWDRLEPGRRRRYADAESARTALSAACVALGRSLVGLPPRAGEDEA